MNLPGFSGDFSLYKSRVYYQTAALSRDAFGSLVSMALPIRNGLAGGNEGPNCRPHCYPCASSLESATGCSVSCLSAYCDLSETVCSGCANPCKGGQFCNGICTNTSSNPNNCGGCGHVCPSGLTCTNGVCGCAPGLTLCNGVCTDTSSDPNNCGTCGTSCGSDPCLGGQCPPPCPGRLQPFPWCGASDSSVSCPCPPGQECRPRCHRTCGCDPFWPFCGCDTLCSTDSFCQPCAPGEVVCGGKCTDLSSDFFNCGACGTVCGPGFTSCSNGTCVASYTVG
jgi:hypothetical protein